MGLAWALPAWALTGWAFSPARLLACAAMLALLTWRMERLWQRRLQGFTGDVLGATQQVCELGFYLALAASPPSWLAAWAAGLS